MDSRIDGLKTPTVGAVQEVVEVVDIQSERDRLPFLEYTCRCSWREMLRPSSMHRVEDLGSRALLLPHTLSEHHELIQCKEEEDTCEDVEQHIVARGRFITSLVLFDQI